MSSKRKSPDRPISPPPTKRSTSSKLTTTTSSLKATTTISSKSSKVTSTTTQAVVSNFFKPPSQKEPESVKYRVVDRTLLIASHGDPLKDLEKQDKPAKVASFDLDSTLIKTKSGNIHARDENDWVWWNPVVPAKVRELNAEGYKIIIFTNQGGMSLHGKAEKRLKAFKIKVRNVLVSLGVPATVYAATEKDIFRKPRPGMWEEMVRDYDLDVHGVEHGESFLVGDAAGRKGDHSASDRHFAVNAGIKFYTPEEFFLGQAPGQVVSGFEPEKFLDEARKGKEDTSESAVRFARLLDQKLEVVVFVGSPGAGKSTFYRNHLEPLGYERVNQDTLKSRDKCLKTAAAFLQEGRSVAVDNTNADDATRALWIKLARKHQAAARCLHFTASPELCQHNDAVRGLGGEKVNPEKREVLPKLAFTGYASRYVQPQLAEGFEDITKVDFEWDGDEEQLKIWRQHWV